EPAAMRLVDERAKVIRTAIESGGRKEVYTVISPTEIPREIGNGKELNGSNPQRTKTRKLGGGGNPGSLLSKGADVHFIEDLLTRDESLPLRITPCKRMRIDYLRQPMRTVRLKARRRI